MGQKGIETYRLQSFLPGTPMIFCSLSATSTASAAFFGIARYSPDRIFLTLVLLTPAYNSSVATLEGRTPVSIPHDGR